jgi:peptide/nickel transport system substrate-binding protein
MQRREIMKLGVATALSAPWVAHAQSGKSLKFVPQNGLTLLDPTVIGGPNTRSHGSLVFDTLYGLDETFTAGPQMLEGHTIENGATQWDLRLREGLLFHDGTPVLAGDAVASIRRWAVRDGFGQALLAATDELTTVNDRTIRFRLTHPFPHLPAALAGSGATTPVVMPARLAATDPSQQVSEMIGSGPYRFLRSEFVTGERSAYERFTRYVPRDGGKASYTSGPKVAHIDRVEWLTIEDSATAASALLRGEVDWLQAVFADQAPMLSRSSAMTVEVTEPAGNIGVMRFNHLHPPFDNPAIRRALLGAMDQSDAMNAVAGTDGTYWRAEVGLFPYGTPLANSAGIDVISGPRDYSRVKRELAEAGYRGEPIVVLGTSGTGWIPALSQVGADMLHRAGMNVDLQLTDFATMIRRVFNRNPPALGGWNMHFIVSDGAFNANLATHGEIRGDGKSGWPGWPTSPRFEALRQDWLAAGELDEQRRIAVEAQVLLWQEVPYIPMGQWLRLTAHRRNLVEVPRGFAAFYGARWA